MSNNCMVNEISPKTDKIFREIFGKEGNEEIAKGFIECVIDKKIEKVDLSNNRILAEMPPEEVRGLVDVVATIDGKKHSFEICILDEHIFNGVQLNSNIIPWYGAYIYAKLAEKNREPKRVTYIFISNYVIEGIQSSKYHTSWALMNEEGGKEILGYSLNFELIEIPKIQEMEEEDCLVDWLLFLENPESEWVKEKIWTNPALKSAYEEYQRILDEW